VIAWHAATATIARMIVALAVAAVAAALLSLIASSLMTKASNLSPAWNIAIGGLVALTIALIIFLLILLVERIAFG